MSTLKANFTIGVLLPGPVWRVVNGQPVQRNMENVPFSPDRAKAEDALNLRATNFTAEDRARVSAMLLSAKTKLGYEGELKEGTFTNGSLWMTLGRRKATDNASEMEAFLSA